MDDITRPDLSLFIFVTIVSRNRGSSRTSLGIYYIDVI